MPSDPVKAKKAAAKRFPSLSPSERNRELAKFDREIDIERDTKPMSAKQREIFDR
jgi:hypothetical protein